MLRDIVWHGFGQDQKGFRDFQNDPSGKMVLKYNPVLVNSGGIITTKTDVDCQFYSDGVVAPAAGVAPPTQAAEDQFIRSLPWRFGSLPREQQKYLRQADVRLEAFYTKYTQTIQTRSDMLADIKRNVHSSADVSREARQLENDSGATGKYLQRYEAEMMRAILGANRIIGYQTQLRNKTIDDHGMHGEPY